MLTMGLWYQVLPAKYDVYGGRIMSGGFLAI